MSDPTMPRTAAAAASPSSDNPTPLKNGSTAVLDEDARSFSVASTSNLKHPHLLHPRAANPVMDLAALVREPQDDQPGLRSFVSLWRLSGAMVWEVRVTGRVLGLAWSVDGLFLSILVLRLPSWPPRAPINATKSSVEHLSVHTGNVVKAVPVPPGLIEQLAEADWAPAAERDPHFPWWSMEWGSAEAEWPPHKPGAPLMIIDSLPGIEPVEPPKPAIVNPFAPPPPAATRKGLHNKLEAAPALLPATPRPPPTVLSVAAPARRGTAPARFLTGTFPLPPGTPEDVPTAMLEVAMRADKITQLLDPVFRGLESCAAAYRDAERQTMIWREELEACGQQEGLPPRDVHADLFRFLMCRRSSAAITSWIGNRLTNRPVVKWDTTVQEGFITVMKVLAQSVIPALERVLLVLEEMYGWARGHHADKAASAWCRYEFEVVLDRAELERATALVCGLLALCEDMRQAAALEWETAVEFFKWLRYEMARSIPNEDAGLPGYDTKLVWSYMTNGFVSSRFQEHFPHVPGAADAVLPELPSTAPEPAVKLDDVLASALARLTDPPEAPTPPEPRLLDTEDIYMRMNDTMSEFDPPEPDIDLEESFDTVGENGHPDPTPAAAPLQRTPALEPWAWANALLATVRTIAASARVRNPSPASPTHDFALPTVDERVIGDEHWALALTDRTLHVLVRADGLQHARFVGEVVHASFYGDEDVALLLARGARRWLALVPLETLRASLAPMGGGLPSFAGGPAHELELSRARSLGTMRCDAAWGLALNPAEGRRTGWVLTGGGEELCVLDLEAHDDEWDEEEEEAEDDEDEGMDEE